MTRRKRTKINLDVVRAYRKRGVPYAQIGAEMDYSPSAIWRAYNQQDRSESQVPAGRHRSTYLPDAHWDLLRRWSLEIGESRAVVIARLVEKEAARRGVQLPTEEAQDV